MYNRKINIITFITSIALISCGKSTKAQQNYPSSSDGHSFIDPNPELTNEINSIVKSKLDNVNKCEKNNNNLDQNCELVEVTPGSESPNAESIGKRVLIIDDKAMRLTAYTRYRKRVLENIYDDRNGVFQSETKNIQIPKIAKNILLDLFYNDKYNKISAEVTNPAGDAFIAKLDDSLNEHYIGHGNYIFNYIANNSPDTQFVVAYSDSTLLDNLLSKNISENNKLKEIEQFFNNQADSLNNYIRKYDINFVTFSGGVDGNYLNRYNLSQMAKLNINKMYYNNFINKITSQNDIIFTQAGGVSNYFVDKSDPHFYSDCKKDDKRIRVGVVKISDKPISKFGSRDKSLLQLSTRNFFQCTDLYINMTNKLAPPLASTFGIGTESFPRGYLTTSFSTPVALSYLLYLKTINQADSNADIISQLNILTQNEFVILDPTFNRQLPIWNY